MEKFTSMDKILFIRNNPQEKGIFSSLQVSSLGCKVRLGESLSNLLHPMI